MIGIALAYQRLNRWDQSSGATYTWVARVFNPYLGFMSGWMILLYYTLGTTTLTIPAGIYTIDLLAPSMLDNHWVIFAVGAAWNVLITALAVMGLRIVARFEWAVVLFEYAMLLAVALVALTALVRGDTAAHFSWNWFSTGSQGGMKGLMGGILIACFMYSGWDAAIYVNEETTDRAENPGKAALASVVLLALIYSIATFAFQSVLAPADLQAHAGNALTAVSGALLSKPWSIAMALVVLTGTLASLQAAVVSAARMGLAMSRDRVMPAYFQTVRGVDDGPWAASLTMGALNLLLLAVALGTTSVAAALSNAASSLGLIAVFFYGLTAAAALRQQRALFTSGARNFILGGLLPLIGVLFSIWVLVESVLTGAFTTLVIVYGAGSLALGALVALFLHRCKGVGFFDRIAPGTVARP
jgi:amino acid transporter